MYRLRLIILASSSSSTSIHLWGDDTRRGPIHLPSLSDESAPYSLISMIHQQPPFHPSSLGSHRQEEFGEVIGEEGTTGTGQTGREVGVADAGDTIRCTVELMRAGGLNIPTSLEDKWMGWMGSHHMMNIDR